MKERHGADTARLPGIVRRPSQEVAIQGRLEPTLTVGNRNHGKGHQPRLLLRTEQLETSPSTPEQ